MTEIRTSLRDLDGSTPSILKGVEDEPHYHSRRSDSELRPEPRIGKGGRFHFARDDREQATHSPSRDILVRVNHEVRTPMNGILGFAELLLQSPLTTEQKCFAETIQQCGHSLLSFWDSLLELSIIEASDLQFAVVQFNPLPIIEETVRSFLPSASRKGIEFIFLESSISHPMISADPARFRQTLSCLLDNAVKFTPSGCITLQWMETFESHFRIEIQDTGIGISRDHLSRLFRPFFQIDSSSTRRLEGCGLGLATAKRLTESQGGQIGCSSELGKGSVFWFSLPIKDSGNR